MNIFIKTDNSAFKDDYFGEISRILKRIAKDYENKERKQKYMDINGNSVCEISGI
jgi:hypothetical protein